MSTGLLMENDYVLSITDWACDEHALRTVRQAVFIDELGIPSELEWDDADVEAVHVLVCDKGGEPIATGRLLATGHIGRMAVMPAWRAQGIGRAMLEALLDVARKRGDTRVWLQAQQTTADLYTQFGFSIIGEPFTAAGIPHVRMERAL